MRPTVFTGRIVTISAGDVLLPDGSSRYFEVIHHPGGAVAVAVDDAGQVCLLRQYRPAAGDWVWELPAGKLEPPEPPLRTAQRELMEEAGRQAAQWQPLGTVLSSPGVFDEVLHLYLARDLSPCPTAPEPGEVLEVHWLPMAEAVRRALQGELHDAKTIIALLRARAALDGRGPPA